MDRFRLEHGKERDAARRERLVRMTPPANDNRGQGVRLGRLRFTGLRVLLAVLLVGAAAVVVMSAKRADQLGLTPLARIASFATVALDPKVMGMGPVPASQKALQRAGWKPADLDLLEINEAFAAQACAVHNEMGWDTSKVNVNGGAIAIGHPIGASGCRILVTLLHEMQKRNAKKGIASLCIGGGMGVALTVER